jgi:hypothetical protein
VYNKNIEKEMAGIKGKSGRKPKEDEQILLESLSKLDKLFFEVLETELKAKKPYALKIFANHRLPKPKIVTELDINPEQPIFNLNDLIDNKDE